MDSRTPSTNGNVKLIFPVSFDLKVIMETGKDEENKNIIKSILNNLKIPFSDWHIRESSKGNYKRYSVNISVESREIMNALYSAMSCQPKIKTVL
jgi:putative lipoic acid-binding regulatory protein